VSDDPREHVPDSLEDRLDGLSSTLTDDDMETRVGTASTSVGIADADTGDADTGDSDSDGDDADADADDADA